jgi:hypothetical protein
MALALRPARLGVLVTSLVIAGGMAVAAPGAAGANPAPGTPTVSGPVTGGTKGYPFRSAVGIVPLEAAGFVEEEFFLEGSAAAYTSTTTPLPSNGVWTVTPSGTTAPYKTRALVRRPADPAWFNGTVVVEWLNVTAGHDTDPDFAYGYVELLRRGYAWVGVSAQNVSVNGSPLIPGFGLKSWDPDRYGSLSHPGDSFSYDIFTQAGRAVRSGALLGDLVPQHVIADGESQSASRMVTYINGVHPLVEVYDGFLVHSRGRVGAALSQSPLPPVGPAPSGPTSFTLIRPDADEPVFVVQAETDVLGSLLARQANTGNYLRWEIAGTAHADWYFLSQSILYRNRDIPTYPNPACNFPVNDGPQHWVFHAAIRGLDTWVRTGMRPATGADISVDTSVTPPALVRDAFGNVKGGIRTPHLDVPLATLSGVGNTPAGFCGLFGTSKALPWDTVEQLYRNDGAYVSRFVKSANDTAKAGFFLADDLDDIKAEAAQSKRVFTEPPQSSTP